MSDERLDPETVALIELLRSAASVEVKVNTCRCGGTFCPNGTPNWQNRWTCDKCGRHVSK